MRSEADAPRSLRDLDLEVEVAGRDWMRRRREEKLQAEANRHGGGFPPERTHSGPATAGSDAPAHGLRRGRTGGVARTRSR